MAFNNFRLAIYMYNGNISRLSFKECDSMKNFFKYSFVLCIGLIIGLLVNSSSLLAGQPIKLIINGKTIAMDVAPQIINGRTMVPAKYVAENLGATVVWDSVNNTVVIKNNSVNTQSSVDVTKPVTNTPIPIISTPIAGEIKETTFKGLKAIEKGGNTYFLLNDYIEKIRIANPKNIIKIDMQNRIIDIIINGEKSFLPILNKDVVVYENYSYLDAKYYLEY